MIANFRFVHPYILVFLFLVIAFVAILRYFWPRVVTYHYSLTEEFKKNGHTTSHPHRLLLFIVHLIILALLAMIIARPQLINSHSTTHLNGVDIMLAIDVSGSMNIADDKHDPRSRIEIAKAEALHFIAKRTDDSIGLVLFAKDAISRCPLTFDKRIVNEIVKEVQLGLLDPSETYLATGLITAANRLKNSKAKSKIIILLTDGAPSEGDLDPQVAIEIAKQLNIKVYTIGIGGDEPIKVMTQFGFGYYLPVNKELLQTIAAQTGGKFFRANNAQDMRAIYDTINALEKTKYEVETFTTYNDLFMYFVIIIISLLLFELICSSIFWFAL